MTAQSSAGCRTVRPVSGEEASVTGESPAIGFIGLGIMGAPMAEHLLRAGHRLFVYNRTRAKADRLIAAGATWCEGPLEVARRARMILLNVPDTPDVERVLFGERGASAGLERGALVVDFSTISPDGARQIAIRLAEKGVAFLDAPVTGGETGARNATLTIMVGGDRSAFEQARPILERLGRKIVYVGGSGSGQLLKACNQILCAVNMIGVCEALTLARHSGLDLLAAIDALSEGSGSSWAWNQLGPRIARDELGPMFMIKLIQKDLRIVQEAAQHLGAKLPGTELAQALFRRVEDSPGGSELGTQGMIRAYQVGG